MRIPVRTPFIRIGAWNIRTSLTSYRMCSSEIDRCLLLLRQTERLLLKNGESILAAQLSIVSGRLRLRTGQSLQPAD